MVVLPRQLTIAHADQAFGPDGGLIDEDRRARLDAVASALVRAAAEFGSRSPGPAADR